MELEEKVKVLENRLTGMQSLVGIVARRIEEDDLKKVAMKAKMKKARAGRKKKREKKDT